MQKIYKWYKDNGLLKIVMVVVVIRVIMSLSGLLVMSKVGTFDNHWNIIKSGTTAETSHSFLNIWSRWDGQWYRSIADNGYLTKGAPYSIHTNKDIVFFPLFPLSSRLLSLGIVPTVLAGLVISNIATVAIIGLLYTLLIKRKTPANVALLCTWIVVAQPMAFIFGAYYSEALFLCLALAYLFYSQLNKKILSFVFGVLAGLTRPTGLVLIVVGAIQMIRDKFWKQPIKDTVSKAVSLSGPLVGYILFATYAFTKTGSWSTFTEAEQQGWGRYLQLSSIFKNLFIQPFVGLNWFAFSAFAWLVIILVIWHRKKIGLDLTIWTLLTIALPLGTSLLGMPRYTITLFTMPLAVSYLLIRKPRLWRALLVSLFIVQVVCFCLWAMNAQTLV